MGVGNKQQTIGSAVETANVTAVGRIEVRVLDEGEGRALDVFRTEVAVPDLRGIVAHELDAVKWPHDQAHVELLCRMRRPLTSDFSLSGAFAHKELQLCCSKQPKVVAGFEDATFIGGALEAQLS